MIHWGTPWLLQSLWLLVPAAWLLLRLLKSRQRRLERLMDARVIPLMAPGRHPRRERNRVWLWLIALALCLTSLARPQWGFHWETVRRRGLDIMVVLDTSKSMLSNDIRPNRLQQAKWGIRDLVQKLRGDRLGLITFSGSSFLQCPLTIDYAAFNMTLDDVYCGIIPRGGTAISEALKNAMDSFEYDNEADRVIVLVTDGEDHEGDPTALIDQLKKKDIRVYAVGVGTIEGELIPVKDEQGRDAGFLKDRDGAYVKSKLNEDPLKKVALGTGGMYVRSAPGDFGLERIYEQGINQLKRAEQESRRVKVHEDRFSWFLGAAFIILIFEALLTKGRRNRQGRTAHA